MSFILDKPPGGAVSSNGIDSDLAASPRHRWLSRVWRGGQDDPRWARPALFGLLAVTAALYLVNLTSSGWANAFYSAAAQAGSVSWKAFLFGSSDAANAITIDKTPGALWFMALSARIFGVSSFSILLPEALMGVASVGLLYSTVKRVSSPASGILAGLVLATTPVAALMFRFNNPDALMVLGVVAAAWAVTRAIQDGKTKWLLWCGAFVGIAFLAKMMQAFLVVPGFGLAYLVAGPPRIGKRVWQLLAALGAMVVTGGWWVATVMVWPAVDRPYIGGSQTNSVLNLLFGYNGFGRLTGAEVGSLGWSDQSSATKLIDPGSDIGGQVSWLLWAALIAMVAGLVITARRPRTDQVRASMIVWGGWLIVTGVTFSAMQGIMHPYYTVALAPAIGALVGISGHHLWKHRDSTLAVGTLTGSVIISGLWAKVLLNRIPNSLSWLGITVLIASFFAAAMILLAALLPRDGSRTVTRIAAALTAAVLLAGPTAYTIDTISTGHTGPLPSAGPTTVGTPHGRAGVMAGFFVAPTPSAMLVNTLSADSPSYTWAAAVIGSNNAAGYQLGTRLPVMAIGGYNGTDPAPTLARFQALAKAGKIHYLIGGNISAAGGRFASAAGSSEAGQIAAWVITNYPVRTVGSVNLYDLTPVGG